MRRQNAFICIILSLFALKAYSGVEIEPYIGYEFSDLKGNTSAEDGSFTQLNIGGRLGFSFAFFSLGVDYSNGSGDGDFDGSTTTFDSTSSELGGYFKITLPLFFQFYATYIANGE